METRMELFARIRRDARVEGYSIRQLARRHQVGRATVRMALVHAQPPPRKIPVRCSPKLDPFKNAIDTMLTADIDAPRKQRHTARRILARLADEHGAQELSYSTVRDYVRVRRAQIDVEAGRRIEVFIPQEHPPGAEAEVDFGEVWVMLTGVKTKCHMFTFRLSHSGKAVHRVYSTQGQEAFLEGHIAAFEEIGGVPARHIRYDNLTSAVQKVIYGQSRARVENPRWVLFRSHFGFDAFYCQPGISGAHEKGGAEGEVGRFRRNRLSPMPVVDSLDELNEKIRAWDEADNGRRINDRIRTVGADFAVEKPLLTPLPNEEFDPGLSLTPRVDRSALITVRMAKYSVPARFIGKQVRVSLRASEVVVIDGRTVIARHQRVVTQGGQSLDLDHYLEVLRTKPGALPGASALAAARRNGTFTAAHDAFWAAARKTDGDAAGTRQLIDVLLLHRTIDTDDVIAGIEAALTVGAVTADVVAVEARRHSSSKADAGGSGSGRHLAARRGSGEQRVVSLTQRRLADPAAVIAGLPADSRPLPSVDRYDQLLRLPTRATTHSTEGTGT
ncbi:MAG: IS21 family transposase [Rhodococcus sp. (in: high G+C Gram-positive bacteria)]|uniref:IS21 family transposase n=1 Tax=Rhodococcus sp. TaxID=1831 RepID=UPI002ADB6786|nr:IS21 family transposase [Rhodococcus sp. (in: high G+C Gram-positive bacteria)]MDZ7917414.1 IS21 family transposase [Rhodococcus sp. (in: high G+C Gram-positive bacteria)]